MRVRSNITFSRLAIGTGLVFAVLALVIEAMRLEGRGSPTLAGLVLPLIILALACSVIGMSLASMARKQLATSTKSDDRSI